jgi:hypothetical protein
MNRQNAREYMPLVQALANGLTIQYNDEGDWMDTTELMTNACNPECYRIKPKPRQFDIWINEKTKRVISVEDGDHDDNNLFSEWERITVQEVLK